MFLLTEQAIEEDDAFINTTHEENDITDELSVQPNNYVLGILPGESPGSTVSSQCYLDIGMDNMQLGVKVEKIIDSVISHALSSLTNINRGHGRLLPNTNFNEKG